MEMCRTLHLFYDPGEDGGWDTYELGEQFKTPLMLALDSCEFLTKGTAEINEMSSGRYRVCAKVLDKHENELLLDGGRLGNDLKTSR